MRTLEYNYSRENNRLINRHITALVMCFSFYGAIYLYEGLLFFFTWHIVCAALVGILSLYPFKNLLREVKVILVYVIVCLDLLYFVSIGGHQIGVELFYIPMILSLNLFFDFEKQKRLVIVSLAIMIMSIVFGFFLRDIFHDSFYLELFKFKQRHFLIINTVLTFSVVGIILYSIYIRQLLNNRFSSILIERYHKFNELNERLGELTSVSSLVDLAKKRDGGFFQKFIIAYPSLIEKLNELCPNICSTELEFCAYLKLNFSTKQIATYTNSTIKSVECKKYRIRKKFDLEPSTDIYVWINSI